MKKKEFLLNILLIFLVFLAIVQSSFLWIELPSLKKSSSAPARDRQSLVKRLFNPEKTAINFAKNDHTVIYDSNDLYKQFRNSIFTNFDEFSEADFTEINSQDYMELMNKKSIVFQFTNKILNSTNLFGLISNNDENINLEEIYISKDSLAYARDGKYFLKNGLDFPEVEASLENLKGNIDDYVPYSNFKEKYGINKNILTRIDNHIISENLEYSKDIKTMDFRYRKNLVERFLNIDIDYVNQITRPSGTIYAYEDKYVNFSNDGRIEYVNNEDFQTSNLKLFSSLGNAIDFIISKLGTVENLKLVDIREIEDEGRRGFKISFNYVENNMAVYPNLAEASSHVELEIFSNHVKSFKQDYRKLKDQTRQNYDLVRTFALDEIIYRNQANFVENPDSESLNYILNNIDSITEVYIENPEDKDQNSLIDAIRIDYKQRELFFSLRTAKLIMER